MLNVYFVIQNFKSSNGALNVELNDELVI